MTAELIRGVDVSQHQSPDAIVWAELAKTHTFLIARSTYGVKKDSACAEHIRRARDVGMKTGLYHFYRPGQDAQEQLDAFASAAEVLGLGPDWLPPALDVERNVTYDGPFVAARYAPAEAMCEAWKQRWGQVLVYVNPSDYRVLGEPPWFKEHLLWIAHWGALTLEPETFGMQYTLWQHKVAPIPGVMAGLLDQNVAAAALPLLTTLDAPALLPLDLDWDEVRRDRDAYVKDKEDS